MATIKVQAVPSNTNVNVQDANNVNVNVQGGNQINLEVIPTPTQTIQINRGVAGNGIESVSIYYDGTTYYLDFLYTDGTNELVPLPSTAAGVASFNTRVGAVTLTLTDVTTALGYTPPTPTGTGATGTWAISVSGNAATVTNGVVTTGTYADPLWITALSASKITGTLTNSQLANSSININGTNVSLGGSIATPQGTITSVTGTSPIVSSGGTTPAISINQATTSTSGFLSSTDWNTFNGKGNGTVTSVAATAGTGISVTGSPITSSGTFSITNTLPDQVVSLTGAGTTTVTGTYPNFTITSTGGSGGTVTSVGITPSTGVTVSNSPITTSGNITVGLSTKLTAIENLSGAGFFTQNGSGNIAGRTIQAGTGISVAHGNGSSQDPTISNSGVLGVTATSPVASSGGQNPVISMPAATTSVSGYLTSTDWNTFNNKTSNTGTVTSVAATAGTGISITGSPITTSGTFSITNTAPDQVVSLAEGSNITITGTYPSFTIASSGGGSMVYPSGTGIAVVTSGTAWGTTLTAPSGAIVGTTDTQTLTNKTLTDPAIIGTTTEDIYTITDGAAFEIDPANGSIQTITLGANRTPAATNFTNGKVVLLGINDGTAYTITWTTVAVTWVKAGGSASPPTLATTGFTWVLLWEVDGVIYGTIVGSP